MQYHRSAVRPHTFFHRLSFTRRKWRTFAPVKVAFHVDTTQKSPWPPTSPILPPEAVQSFYSSQTKAHGAPIPTHRTPPIPNIPNRSVLSIHSFCPKKATSRYPKISLHPRRARPRHIHLRRHRHRPLSPRRIRPRTWLSLPVRHALSPAS